MAVRMSPGALTQAQKGEMDRGSLALSHSRSVCSPRARICLGHFILAHWTHFPVPQHQGTAWFEFYIPPKARMREDPPYRGHGANFRRPGLVCGCASSSPFLCLSSWPP